MMRWEYHVEIIHTDALDDVLTVRGQQGWEGWAITASVDQLALTYMTLYMKRPIEEGNDA